VAFAAQVAVFSCQLEIALSYTPAR